MIDTERIAELRAEIGGEDLALVLDLFVQEAREALERLEAEQGPEDLPRVLHFLHGGALNMGLRGFAQATATIEAERSGDASGAAARLRAVLDRSCQVLACHAGGVA